MKHECKQMAQSCEEKGSYGRLVGVADFGPSIRYIEYLDDPGVWVAHCDEYATIIEYCPFCGIYLRSLL
jgi:hypothetical protein